MSSVITTSSLSWKLPDGRPLFSDLSLSFDSERTGLIGRNGVGKTTLFRLLTGEWTLQSGSIAVNGTLGLLRQTIQVDPRETIADLFGITSALARLRRIDEGTCTDEDLNAADWTVEARLAAALARLQLEVSAETRLATLSGGQRTRAALAALVFAEPDCLLLDEPTNNLDREGRAQVISLLSQWRSAAIVVSHDRELLETMDCIVELTSLGATRYGGNWSHYRERKAQELEAAHRDLAEAEKRVSDLGRKAQAQREKQARRDREGRRRGASGSMPKIVAGSLKRQSEETAASQRRLAERRRIDAEESAKAAREKLEVLEPFKVAVPSTGLPPHKEVFSLDAVTVGYDPSYPILREFSCALNGPERVAIVGPNGCGKSTLLALVSGGLKPTAGQCRVHVPQVFFDQRVSLLDPALSIRDNFHRLNPETKENVCRAALARFRFRAEAAMQITGTLSGGQLLRAGLACVLGGPAMPSLLLLDEPTNHLDLDSIEAVEAGLRGYDGALLVVSHDEAFLEAIGVTRRIDLAHLNPSVEA